MRHIFTALSVVAGLASSGATAQDNGTVVELYTSQGCSSCPPADAMLEALARRDDVIPLALHVDYWDYIGWKDDLASPVFTRRQHALAAEAGSTTVYTPQMFVGGTDSVVGSREMAVMDLIQEHNARPDPVTLSLSRSGDTLSINASAAGNLTNDLVVQIVRYTPMVNREILRGENAGRTISYANVVTSWQNAGTWNSGQASTLAMQAQVTGSDPVVVIIQDGTSGPIMAAARLR